MTDKGQDGGGFLKSLRGNLALNFMRAIQWTPIGIATGLNPYARSVSSEELKIALNDTLRDVVRDTFIAAKWISTGGDGIRANATGDEIEQWWRKRVTANIGMGVAEFRMGAGWPLPAGMLYNGKIDKEKQGKDLPLDSVFVRYKNGNVEVLDHNDPRYKDLVVPYIIGQLAIPAGVSKATMALKAISASSKGATLAIGTAGYATSVADLVGGVGIAGQVIGSQLILKPAAIERMARLMDSPQSLTPSHLRDQLNRIFEQYGYLNGPMSERFYVPPLASDQNPFERLRSLSHGAINNVFESAHPFDRVTDLTKTSRSYKTQVDLSDARDEVAKNDYFLRGYYRLSKKALSGQNLSDQECTMLVFGTNVFVGHTRDILPQNGKSFTEQEKEKIVSDLRSDLQARLGVQPQDLDNKLSSGLENIEKAIIEKEAFERQKLQAQAQARMLMMH